MVSYDQSRRRLQQRKRRNAAIVIALMIVAALVAAFAWQSNNRTTRAHVAKNVAMRDHNLGSGVSVSGAKVPEDIAATVAKDAETPSLRHITSVSSVISFTPAGKLPAPVTLRFKLPKAASTDDPNFVYATRETNKDPWEYIHATPTKDGKYVTVTVEHFSLGSLLHLSIPVPQIELWNNPKDVLDLQQEFKDNLTSGWTEKAERPRCLNESKARQDSYHIDWIGKGSLYWCFGIENNKRVLKVVNRRHYPLDIDHKGLRVVGNGHFLANLPQLSRLATLQDHIILFPGDTAVFSVELKMGSAGRAKAAYSATSGGAVTLDGLQTALLTANSLAMKSNAPGAKRLTQQETYKVMNYLLQGKDCYNAVASANQADLYMDCFGATDPEKLHELSPKLGTAGLLESYLKDIGAASTWFRKVVSANIDSLKGDDDYGIVIRRYNPFQEFVGSWATYLNDTGSYWKLDVRNDGTATYKWRGTTLCPGETDRSSASCDKNYVSQLSLKPTGEHELLATVVSSNVDADSGSTETGQLPGEKFYLESAGDHLLFVNLNKSGGASIDLTRQ